MNILILTCVLLSISCGVRSMYEDQAGKFDWRSQYVGRAVHASFDRPGQLGKRIFVATAQNVLASINARNGAIGWRHILESGSEGKVEQMVVLPNNVIAVNPKKDFIRSFHPVSGILQWEHKPSAASDQGHGIKHIVAFGDSDENLAILSDSGIEVLQMLGSEVVWSKPLTDSSSVVYFGVILCGSNLIVAGYTPGSHVLLRKFDQQGSVLSQSEISAPWLDSIDNCIIAQDHLICTDPDVGTIKTANLCMAQTSFSVALLQDLGLTQTAQLMNPLLSTREADSVLFAVKLSDTHIAVLSVNNGQVTLFRDLPGVSAIQIMEFSGDHVLMTLTRIDNENGAFKAFSTETNQELPELNLLVHYPGHHGLPAFLQGVLYKRKDGQIGMRLLVISEDHSMLLYQQNSKVSWSREEALASILAAEMVDLPVSQIMAKMEDEFGSTRDNIISMFIKRFTTQFQQFVTFVHQVHYRLTSSRHHHRQDHEVEYEDDDEDDDDDDDYLTRDEFSLHKMIVLVTAPGKIFGMDNTNGHIIWRTYLSDIAPMAEGKLLLFVQRTTAHFPHHPQCSVLGRHKTTGRSLIFTFHPISGVPAEGMAASGQVMDFTASQVMLLPHPDEEFLKPLLFLDQNMDYHFYPSLPKSMVKDVVSNVYMFTTSKDKGTMQGYGMLEIGPDQYKAMETWKIDFKKDSQVIMSVTPKRSEERVHSQGVVLGDRSVMYKYANPNLVVVVTAGEEGSNKNFVNVYLVDAVSGYLVFHCTHKRAKGPVQVVHSENWVVYNYWNEKHRRMEMSVLELYEGKTQSNATAFSSLHPPVKPPLTMRQSYIFPGHITAMAATITEIGITSKHILIALESGGILEFNRVFLSARRPEIPSQESREEGLIPYIPELPRPFEATINYNQSVYNIRGIHTAPAGLESTCLVLAYGLDLFCTRVTPSLMFDVLKDDFDYFFISCVVLGMIIVSIVSQKLAARKALHKAWK